MGSILRCEICYWSKKTRVDLKYLFGKHVLPIVGNQPPRQVTFTSLKLLLNKLAADGYGETSVGRITTYIKACFEFATDEKGEARIGRTKTKKSDSSVPVPPDLSREIAAFAWTARRVRSRASGLHAGEAALNR